MSKLLFVMDYFDVMFDLNIYENFINAYFICCRVNSLHNISYINRMIYKAYVHKELILLLPLVINFTRILVLNSIKTSVISIHENIDNKLI